MRIESSSLSLEAAHRLASVTAVEERVIAPARVPARDSVNLSPAAQATLASEGRDDLEGLDGKQRMAALTVEAMLGRKISWRGGAGKSQPARQGPPPGGGEIRRRTEIHAESEQLAFRARGSVQTADGRQISFSVSMKLEREFVSISSQEPARNAKDPLVVDFGGKPARVSGGSVTFDLDSDGTAEKMPFVADGSGFLMLDSNHDGRATDGSELFGAKTGDGFAELARYDSDGNGWIDEGDPIFGDLRLWTSDGLSTLADKGVGAISVTAVETPFSFRDANNTEQARLRGTGVFLSEQGAAGTVRQLDLVTT